MCFQGILELQKKGVVAAALIKKQKYWPEYIDGDAMNTYFNDKEVRTVDVMKGYLDGVVLQLSQQGSILS